MSINCNLCVYIFVNFSTMTKTYKRSGTRSGIAIQKKIQGTQKLVFDMHKLVKMLGFTNEFNYILDFVIYGRSIKAVKYAIVDKWNDAKKNQNILN